MARRAFRKRIATTLTVITAALWITGLTCFTPRASHAGDDSFFAKHIDCTGIPVRASKNVEDRALQLACAKIDSMLTKIPEVRASLIRSGGELHIIGRNEQTSDLPEFRDKRGVVYRDNMGKSTTIDERARGMGGKLSSCGEENLLKLANDRYAGLDICTHEFSHGVMDFGLTESARTEIALQYRKSLSKGLWKNAYAAVNAREFWAELSMWYFGSHGSRFYTDGTPSDDGAGGLRAYDSEAFSLLDRLYNRAGKEAPETAAVALSKIPLPAAKRAVRIDDLGALPLAIPGPETRVALYQKFLSVQRPRAIAFALEGRGGSVTTGGAFVADRAVEGCEAFTQGKPCKIYAVNDDVLW